MAMKKYPLMGLLLLLTIVGSPTTADEPRKTADTPQKTANAPPKNATEPVCPPKPSGTNLNRAYFPKGFLFGTATAAYQVEGGVYESGRGRSMWDVYCKKHPKGCNDQNGDVAVDFFHRYKEDIQLMKNLNTNAFRMSISWPRIFPYGKRENGVSQAGVKFYHDVIDELNRNGITPSVTIFHWDTPQELEDEYGGFLDKKIVKDFRNYAEFLFQEYGGKVKYWITINEPWVYAHAGYDVGKKAPGRCSKHAKANNLEECLGGASGDEAYQVTHNLLLAHAEAVAAFRQCKKWHQCEGGKIGIAHSPAWFEPYKSKEEDDTGRSLDFMLGWHLDPTTDGDYPDSMKKHAGKRLPEFTKEEKDKLTKSTDFVGINYYTSMFAKKIENPNNEQNSVRQDSGSSWEVENEGGFSIGSKSATSVQHMTVYSRGLRHLLKHIKKNYDNPEIMIMENGFGEILADKDSVTNGTADDNRMYYLLRHLYSLYQAICVDKVNVTGYFVWSLLDNFEWQDGYKVRFGLYYVDFKNNLKRHEKVSGKFYREFLSEGVRPSENSNQKTEL